MKTHTMTDKLTVNKVQLNKDKNTMSGGKARASALQSARARKAAEKTMLEITALGNEPECVTDNWARCVDIRDCLSDDAAVELGKALSKKCRGDLSMFTELYKDESKRSILAALVVLQDAYQTWNRRNKRARKITLRLLEEYAAHPKDFHTVKPFDMKPCESRRKFPLIDALPDTLRNRVVNAVLGVPPAKMSDLEKLLVKVVKDTCLANEYFDNVLWPVVQFAVDDYTAAYPEFRGVR